MNLHGPVNSCIVHSRKLVLQRRFSMSVRWVNRLACDVDMTIELKQGNLLPIAARRWSLSWTDLISAVFSLCTVKAVKQVASVIKCALMHTLIQSSEILTARSGNMHGMPLLPFWTMVLKRWLQVKSVWFLHSRHDQIYIMIGHKKRDSSARERCWWPKRSYQVGLNTSVAQLERIWHCRESNAVFGPMYVSTMSIAFLACRVYDFYNNRILSACVSVVLLTCVTLRLPAKQLLAMEM